MDYTLYNLLVCEPIYTTPNNSVVHQLYLGHVNPQGTRSHLGVHLLHSGHVDPHVATLSQIGQSTRMARGEYTWVAIRVLDVDPYITKVVE